MADVAGSKAAVVEAKRLVGDLAALSLDVEAEDLLATDAGQLVELSGALDRLSAGLRMSALDRVLGSGVWKDEGARSPQRWLAARLGVTVAEAARIVATTERLRDQAKTREAMRKGELSDDEADAVSGANEAEPEREDEHLGAATGGGAPGAGAPGSRGPEAGAGGSPAGGPGPRPGPAFGPRPDAGSGGDRPRESVAELRRRRERAKARADRDAKEREQRLHRERTASMGTTSEGGWFLSSRNTKGAGQRVESALAAAMDELRAERRAAGLPALTYGQMLADALVRIADKALGTVAEPSGVPARRAMGSRRRGLLLCDLSGLRRGWLEGEETCEIAGFGTVSLAQARELLGEGLLSLVLKDGRDVVNVTPLADFTDLQRDAIWARAMGVCEVPGCGCTVGLEIDHDHERQHGGPSTIANASLKCRQHHQDKTHRPKRLIGPPGRRAWIDVDQLPFDPARDGPIPLEHIEHLLPPVAPSPTVRAGPAPPRAAEAPSEQLDLLTC